MAAAGLAAGNLATMQCRRMSATTAGEQFHMHPKAARQVGRDNLSTRGIVAAASRGGGGGGGGRGRGRGGGGQKPKRRPKQDAPPPEAPRCTGPVETKVMEILADPAPAATPLWSTFCGNNCGEWHGSAIAFNPITAKPEAMTLNEDRRKVFEMSCVTVEDREVTEDGTDQLTRAGFRACDPLDIASAGLREKVMESEDDTTAMYEGDELISEEDGLAIFEGGSYSQGPIQIGSDGPDEETFFALEQCVNWGGHERVRCHLLLSSIGGDSTDIDIDVMRLVVFYEKWVGPPGYCDKDDGSRRTSCELPQAPEKVTSERMIPGNLAGEWKSFDIGALPVVDDVDGTGERQMLAYFSSETKQNWESPEVEPNENGIALWLPGRVSVSMAISPGFLHTDTDGGLSMGGIVFGLGWMPKDGTWVGLEREYSGEGLLREVRSSTACQGGWIGGAM